jgi:lysophospholipase L1-like esterase
MKHVIIAVAIIALSNLAEAADLAAQPNQPAALFATVANNRLAFDSPETRSVEFTAKTPPDFAKFFEAWDPWPEKDKAGKPNFIRLTPKADEDGTLILGSLYRAFIAESVEVTSADGQKKFAAGTDYAYNTDWGQIANLDGKLGAPSTDEVKVKAQYRLARLDLVQADVAGKLSVKKGQSRMVCPQLPEPDAGCRAVAGAFVAETVTVFPIEAKPPVAPINPAAVAHTLGKLQRGEPVKIAFLGDSITLGAEAPKWWDKSVTFTADDKTYPGRFIQTLRQRFPNATISPLNISQGGKSTEYGVAQIQEKILPAKPDLLIIAFGANDSYGSVGGEPRNPPAEFQKQLLAMIRQMKAAGSEVILVTSLQVNPALKNRQAVRQPAYRQVALDVAATEQVGVADVWTEWLNLAARGIPPQSQLHNCNNHPGAFGHSVYADVLSRFFTGSHSNTVTSRQESDVIAFGIAQPETIPGDWEMVPQPLPVLPPPAEQPVYGLYCWADEFLKHRAFIREVGWKKFRLSGPINDEVMKAYAEEGAEVMYTMASRRPFASPQFPMGEWRNRKNYAADQAFIDDYLAEVTKVLERYAANGTFWKENPAVPQNLLRFLEIYNEPNFWYLDTARDDQANHFPPTDPVARKAQEESRQKLYAKLLGAAYRHIKSRWPEVTVIGFAAGGGSVGADVPFITAAHADPAVAGSYDVLSTHPYVRPAPPEGACVRPFGKFSMTDGWSKIRSVANTKPIWWTELNWTIFPTTGGTYDEAKTTGRKVERNTTPELQAAYTVRAYVRAMRLGVERLYFMSVVDTDNTNSGLLNNDGTKRPSAHAVATLLRMLPRPKLVEALAETADGYYAYWFDSGKDARVLMVWNVAGPKTVTIPWSAKLVRITDMVGAERTFPVKEGVVHLRTGPCPVYLQ